MKVQILNKDSEVAWSHDSAAQIDQSGKSWRNGNHKIMAGVIFSLRQPLEQANEFPKEKDWRWAFPITPGSINTIQQIGQRVALEEPLKVADEPWQACHLRRNSSTDQSCHELIHKIFVAAVR